MLQLLREICFKSLRKEGKRPGHLVMTFEDIPYWKYLKSLKKYASNPLGKRPGHLAMTFEDVPD